jgi:serine/threonine protein kinase
MIGKTISHYRIIEQLGAGGMGVVYKAEDTKLKRTVALKFLPPELTRDPEAKARFIREAQAASSLDHPNICTIHEINETEPAPGEPGGQMFIVMACYEGETLKDKIKDQRLNTENAINIAIQIAQGLARAHEEGFVHRDIKPANIIITDRGEVKILDFGLAKLAGQAQLTKDTSTLGTVAYMSPEQLSGKDVDQRTDIWSLGVVLYEMLTGELPFKGDYEQAIIYAILTDEPEPIIGLRSGILFELERILNKCLEKHQNFRYQSTSDILTDLKRMKRDSIKEIKSAMRMINPAARQRFGISMMKKLAALAMSAVLIAVILYFLILKPQNAPIQSLSDLRLIPLISGNETTLFPSWSPDGIWIAYTSDEAGNLDVWKKPIEGGKAVQLTTGLHNESQPSWAPDGRKIAFISDKEGGGGIFLIPSEGGIPWRLTSFGAHPTWSPDGETLAFDWGGNIYLVSYKGGEPRLVVSGTSAIPYMNWTPDGENLIFWNRTKADIYFLSINDGVLKPLELIPSGQEVSGITLSRDGRRMVLSLGPFGGNKNLWIVDINTINKKVGQSSPLSLTITEDIQCAFSPDGNRLAFAACQMERHLWAFPIDPTTGLTKGEPERITFKSKHNCYPSFSPNGQMLVWTAHLTSQGVICIKNLEKHEEKKVTREWGQKIREIGGCFAPDGRQICYSSTLRGSYEIWRLPSLGSIGLRLTETKTPIRDALTTWSPDGKTIAFYSNRMGNWDIWSVQADGSSQPKRLTKWESNEIYPTWSPDGRNVAFRTDKDGNADIWIMDSNGEDPKAYVTHSAEEGWSAWSPNGRWFYFISNRGGIFDVWVKPTRGSVERKAINYQGLSLRFPESMLFTKFAVSSSLLIVPLEIRRGDIYILENIK